jgi:hypothetical protein
MSREWSVRPSELLGLSEDTYTAFCVDEAVFVFGTAIEAELASMTKYKTESDKAFTRRRQQAMNRWLEIEPGEDSKRFASPIATK